MLARLSASVGRLVRTTTFKMSVVYLVVFGLMVTALLVYIGWNTQRLLGEPIARLVMSDSEALAEQFTTGGIRRLALAVERRAAQPGAGVYLLTTFAGDPIAGNATDLPNDVLENAGWHETRYRRPDDAEDGAWRRAIVRVVRLPGGFRLVVGRDIEERERLRAIFANAFRWSIAGVLVIGLGGGLFVTRRVLARIDAMSATTRTIMNGDLGGRLAVTGSRDEFDRLAENLNAMLGRIEDLMRGMKEVSDNIAHDLKTPLTRLRAQAEGALRTASTPEDYRAALEATIEESDRLIATFNALLMIARAEAGNAREGLAPLDAAEAVREVAELYEPVAEERGVPFVVEAPAAVPITGSRELIGQALANLVDNALKYGGRTGGRAAEVTVGARREGARAILWVADRGPGIPEADRARVLERFVRLERSRSEPGSGLGLSLVRAVARLHGGDVRLEDAGPGLRVVLDLPLAGAS